MFSRLRVFFRRLGPGFVTGASDDDPSGIATYAQAGAGFGFSTLWSVFFTIPLMIAIQEVSARIALVTGKGIFANVRKRYPRPLVFFIAGLLLVANTINLGADLGMMASTAQMFVRIPFATWICLIALLTMLLEIFTSYKTYAKYLKWLCLTLLAYPLAAFASHVSWPQAIGSTFFPHPKITTDYLMILVAVLGTTISPYLFFWQGNQEIEEEKADGHLDGDGLKRARRFSLRELKNMRFDVGFGMVFSNVISWFIILTAATTLFAQGGFEITSADQAARALVPIAGSFASALFALGIIGTGLLAVPILAGTAAYAMSEVFGLAEGLSKKWWEAKAFYAIIAASIVIGGLMNFLGIPPIRALIYAAVLNGLISPPIIWMILRIGEDQNIMGEFRSRSWWRALGWLTFAVMVLAPLLWGIVAVDASSF